MNLFWWSYENNYITFEKNIWSKTSKRLNKSVNSNNYFVLLKKCLG